VLTIAAGDAVVQEYGCQGSGEDWTTRGGRPEGRHEETTPAYSDGGSP